MNANMPQRHVYCEDALAWLNDRGKMSGCSLVTSLPDFSEFPKLTLMSWQTWFKNAAALVLSACSDDGVSIFYQSDIKNAGLWIDKSYLCQKAAEETGHALLWHKIICRTNPGQVSFGRPAYAHLLCFSKNVRLNEPTGATADVLPEAGEQTWQRGIGVLSALMIAQFILEQTNTRTIVNPFCGEGSVLAAANALGISAIGIDRSPKRIEKARYLGLDHDLKKWVTSKEFE